MLSKNDVLQLAYNFNVVEEGIDLIKSLSENEMDPFFIYLKAYNIPELKKRMGINSFTIDNPYINPNLPPEQAFNSMMHGTMVRLLKSLSNNE